MDSHWICTASTGHNLNRMYRNMEQLIGMANNMLNKTMTMATKGFVPSKPCHQNDNGCHHTIYNFCYLGQHAVSNSIFFGGHQGTMIQLKRRPTAPTGTTASIDSCVNTIPMYPTLSRTDCQWDIIGWYKSCYSQTMANSNSYHLRELHNWICYDWLHG